MDQLSPAYLVAMADQLGGTSAFLGGFAATYLVMLLTLGQQSRLLTVSVALASLASIAFIVAVVAASMLSARLHPDAPAVLANGSIGKPRGIMTVAFGLGIYALLGAIGCSGWLRSRRTGWVTTTLALIGFAAIASLTITVDLD